MKTIFFAFFLILLISSCETDTSKDNYVVGTNLLDANSKVLLIDTLTVDVSTINFDSLETSSKKRILLGTYNDPIFGKVKSESYFQFSPSSLKLGSSDSDTYTPNYVYDSIALILKYDTYYYGDTTNVQTLNVHKLTQKVKPNTDDNKFYNNSTLTYDNTSIGSITYHPRPKDKDSLNITLNNSFGLDLFQKLKQVEFADINQFHDYFKGIIIKPTVDNNSNVVISYTTSSVIRLYYSIDDDSDENDGLYKDLSISDESKQFNNIVLNRTGTILQNLPISSETLSSTLTNSAGYIQSGTGIACRIDFPHIRDLRTILNKGIIVDAELLLKPVKNTYSLSYPLKDSLRVFESDHLNRISKILRDTNGNDILGKLNTNLDEFGENVQYKVNIGNFLNNEMLKTKATKSSLIITLPRYSKEVNRIVLGNQNNSENKLKLKIYYLPY